jgi:hypothetical protein
MISGVPSKHVETLKNFGIINSITKLHLVGISTESSTMHGSMSIKFIKVCIYIYHFSYEITLLRNGSKKICYNSGKKIYLLLIRREN